MALKIPLLYGSMRDGRKSEAAAKLIHAELVKRGVESAYVSPEKYRSLKSMEKGYPAEWKKIMSEADGLCIVSPEYNHGYPGPLKEMLDSLYEEYHYKPVGICGAAGFLGGGRMVEQLREVVVELKMVPIREAIYIPMVWDAFNPDGTPKDPAMTSRWDAFFQELMWWAQVCKEGRENHPWPKK